MSQNIDSKNEKISGKETFTKISRFNHKNFDLLGKEYLDEHVVLDALEATNSNVKQNPDIDFYGYSGRDTLEYKGDTKSVDISVVDHNTVYISGGQKAGSSKTIFNSLDVWAHDVEVFDLTRRNDRANFDGLSFGVEVSSGSGDDTITGTGSGDFLNGGDEQDRIFAGRGNDTVYGGNHADVLFGDIGRDEISGGDGGDHVDGGSGNDTLYGGDGEDSIYGGEGADLIYGGRGHDTIWGEDAGHTASTANQMHGESGHDVIHGSRSHLAQMDIAFGGTGDDWIHGYSGDDVLDGGAGADTLFGGDGDDILSSGSLKDQEKNDHLWGGKGADTFIISDGSNEYTSDYVIDISGAFPETGGGWTSMLDAGGNAIGVVPKLKPLGSAAKVVASGFDAYYESTADRQTTFVIDSNWGTTAEVFVKDFNPFEDHILVPIAATESGISDQFEFNWDPVVNYAFHLRDLRDAADAHILSVQWDPNLASYMPRYMTVNGEGVTVNSDYYDAMRASLKESFVTYDGDKLFFGDELQADGMAGAMDNSGLGFMDVGAYSGWTIFDNELNNIWMGTSYGDVLGAFVPEAVNSTTTTSAAGADSVQLFGMGGDDLLFGGAGNDTIDGGEQPNGAGDRDTVAFYQAESVYVDLGKTSYDDGLKLHYASSNAKYYLGKLNDQDAYKTDIDRLYNIENVVGTEGKDSISGDTAANVLSGEGGDDLINGAQGNDTLFGGGGDNTFVFTGNFGHDTVEDFAVSTQ